MSIFYFKHGWGYDRHFFSQLNHLLPHYKKIFYDSGYFNDAQYLSPPLEPWIGIGHSAGVPSLIENINDHCLGIISINGFATFTKKNDFPQGVAPRILKLMNQQLNSDAHLVIKNFRKTCHDFTACPQHISVKHLSEGLKELEHYDVRKKAYDLIIQKKLFEINSNDDPLSPARYPIHKTPYFTFNHGGHLLPQTNPIECARIIKDITHYLSL